MVFGERQNRRSDRGDRHARREDRHQSDHHAACGRQSARVEAQAPRSQVSTRTAHRHHRSSSRRNPSATASIMVHQRGDLRYSGRRGSRGLRRAVRQSRDACSMMLASRDFIASPQISNRSRQRACSSSSPEWKARCRRWSRACVDKPVIAVPTSVGYGTAFGGIAALLGMLNTCSSGVTVVNIDNGFGAALAATLINRVGLKRRRLMAKRDLNYHRPRAARDEDGRARVAGRLQLSVDLAAAPVPQRARARTRAARNAHQERATDRRRIGATSRRVPETDPDALDAP